MTVTSAQLRAELVAAGIPPAAILPLADVVYMPCKLDWLRGDFHRWFFKVLERFDIATWTPELGDCDDFVALFMAFARIAHRRTPAAKVAGAALPIGRIIYRRSPEEVHAINWAFVVDGGRARVVFPEPQSIGQLEDLSSVQLQSISKCDD